MNETPAKQIVFIVSNLYSGSTWLSYVLGSHPTAATLGEHHRRFEGERTIACRYCSALGRPDCEVLEGILNTPLAEAYNMPLQRFAAMGITTLIDNSKQISWLERLLTHGACDGLTIKVIHLVRDPRGWMASCLSRNPQLSIPELINHWKYELIKSEADLARLQLPVHRTCYDLMHLAPHHSMAMISDFVGISYSTDQYDYWHRPHHAMGANGASINVLPQQRGRTPDREYYLSRFKTHFHDERWRYRPDAELLTKICNDIDLDRLLEQFGGGVSKIDELAAR